MLISSTIYNTTYLSTDFGSWLRMLIKSIVARFRLPQFLLAKQFIFMLKNASLKLAKFREKVKTIMNRIISVINQKGGVGKTTTAVNLAAYIAKTGKKVLLADLDPQANATSGLGFDKFSLVQTTNEVLTGNTPLGSAVVATNLENVWILPSNTNLAGAEVQLVSIFNRESVFKTALYGSIENYDFVIIDCPPSLGLLTINALTASTDVLIPVQTEYYAMEGIGQLMQTIQLVQQNLNQTLQIMGVLLTMYDARNSLSEQVRVEIVKTFGDLVFKTIIPRNVRLAEAPSHGKPIMQYDKWSKGARAYKTLAKEVISRANG